MNIYSNNVFLDGNDSGLGRRPMLRDSSFGGDYEKEINVFLGEQQRQQEEADEFEKELNLYEAALLHPPWTVPLVPLPESFSEAEMGLVEAIKEVGLVVMIRSLGIFL